MIWTIIQLVISGIAMGFVYALIGIEYTLIYNASGVLNFSHDKMVSLGAYIYAGMFVLGLGWNSVVSAIASLLLMAEPVRCAELPPGPARKVPYDRGQSVLALCPGYAWEMGLNPW